MAVRPSGRTAIRPFGLTAVSYRAAEKNMFFVSYKINAVTAIARTLQGQPSMEKIKTTARLAVQTNVGTFSDHFRKVLGRFGIIFG